MPRVSGPTISRWRLGEELRNLRQEAGLTFAAVAEDLGCSESKIRKIESGDVGVGKAEFERLLELYKVDPDDDLRHALADLQKLGKQRGWWAQYGSVPSHWANYLALESEATSLRIFEPMIVHGLLQTDEYASALDEAITGGTPAEMERFLRIRTDRKKHVWESNDPPRIWAILDEAALRRMVGGPDVMRARTPVHWARSRSSTSTRNSTRQWCTSKVRRETSTWSEVPIWTDVISLIAI
jgi:transcriptional regulator with XRE-family HTH domain